MENLIVVDYKETVLPVGCGFYIPPSRSGKVIVNLSNILVIDGTENVRVGLHPLLKKAVMHFNSDRFLDYQTALVLAEDANKGKIVLPAEWENYEIPCMSPIKVEDEHKVEQIFFPFMYYNLFWGFRMQRLDLGFDRTYKLALMTYHF